MDLSFSRHIWRLALLMGMLFLALSCIMDKDFPMDEEWMGKEAVLFNVLAEPASKLSYEGVHTSFVNGESVGCIIAEKNGEGFNFGVSTKWTYQDGALKLESADNEYVARHMEDGYVTLVKPEVDYAFFFYYPYSEGVTESNWMSLERNVLTDFSGDEATTVSRLSDSDHLWTRHLHGVATTGMKTVDLTFKKKTATVEIHCDHGAGYTISDVKIDAISGSEGVQTRMHMNLTNGSLTTSDAEGRYDGIITPGLIHEEEGSIHESGYRMIFVPQTILSWRLHATITEGGNNKEYNIALEDKLRTLEEGKLYIFHVAKAGDGYILINDWNSDNTDNLIGEEVDVPTDLTMWADPSHNPEKYEGAVVIKAGDNLIIKGTDFWKTDHCIVDKVQLEGARVFAKSQENPDGFVLSEDPGDGYRTITFKLPDTAKDGPVYLVMPSGVMVSPGSIYTVKPVVTELDPASFDMSGYNAADPQSVTLEGTDLDLVEKVIFGGDYAVDVDPSVGTSLTALIPQFAQTGNIRLVLKNGLVIDSGKQFTVVNPQEEVKVTSVSGRFTAGEIITVKGLHLSETGKIHLTGADSQPIVLDKTEDFKIDGDGTITFEFPAEARDGSMTFYKGSSLITIPVQIGSQEAAEDYPYETLMPSYLEVQKIDNRLYVYGKDLDVIGTVTLNSSTVGDAHIEGSEIYFNWDEELKGNIRLTSKNGKFVDLPYDFTPTAPIVTSISALQGNLTKTVVDANGQSQEVEDPLGIKVGAGDKVILHGSYLNLAKKVRVRDQEIGTFEINDDKTELTFTFASVSMNGYIYLVTESGVEVNVGRYELAGSVSVSEVNGIFRSGNQVTLTGEYLGRITSIDVSDVDGTTNKVTLADGYDDVDFVVSDDGKSLTFNYPEAGQNNGTGKLVFYSGNVPVGEYTAVGLNVTEYGRYGNEIYLNGENLEGATVKLNDAPLNPSYDSGNGRLVIDHSKSGNEAARTYEGTFVVSTKHGYSVEKVFDFYPEVSGYSPQPVSPGQDLTISGENLDLMNCVVFDENNSVYVNLPNPSDEAYGQVTLTVPAGSTGNVKFRLVTGSYRKPEKADLEVNPLNGDELLIWNGSGENVTFVPESENWAKVKAGDRLIVYTGSNDNYNKDWSFILKDGAGNALVGTETYKNSTGVLITLTSEMIEQINVNGGINITLENGFVNKVSVLTRALPAGITVTSIKSERDNSEDTVVEAKAGNVVTVYGTGLKDITSVQINDVVSWGYSYQDDGTQMSFYVPDTGDGAIKAYSSSKNEWFIIGNYETVVPVLVSYGRDNNWSVYVTGSDLDMVSTVVSPSAYNYSLQGDKYVIPVSNDIDKIKGTIVLATKYGKETNSLSYDFTPTGITYDKDYYAVNSNVTISGDNLDMIKSVEFAGAASPVTLYNAPGRTEFTVTVPSDAETGVLKFTLLDGSTVDGPELFIKKASISDINGLFKSGETVTVTGENLDMITKVTVADQWGNNQITVGDKRLDNGNLLFTYPSASWQDGVAKIQFYVGDYNVVKEYVTILPVVSNITRDSNFIIIEGVNLGYVADVKLDDVSVSYAYDKTGYEGKITLGVMEPIKATAKLITKHGYEVGREYDFSPVVSTDLSTLGTKSPGNEFTIQGNNLDLVSVVYFTGGSSDDSPEASADGKSLLITVPEGAATGPIRLQVGNNNQYDVTTSSSITIGAQPTVTSVTGSTPGETVTVVGTNLNLITSVVVPVDGGTQTINNFTLENENTVLKFVLPNNACTGTMTFYQDQAIVHEHSLTVDSGTGGGNDPGTGDGEEIVLMESVEGLPDVTINDVSSLKAGCKLVINYTWPEPDNNNWGGTLYVEAGDKTWGENEKVISRASFNSTSKHSFVITSDMLTKIMNNQSKITIWKNAYDGIKITKVSVIKSVSE